MFDRLNKRLSKVNSALWMKIAQIDELKGKWSAGLNVNPQVLGNLKKSVLITSSGSSTRIEGAKLSDEDVEKLMRGISIQKFTDRDMQEVQGYYELLENVFNNYKQMKFSETTIKHFHKELLRYVEKDKFHLGEYKKGENKVEMLDASGKSLGIVFETTPAYLTPKEMSELVTWYWKSNEKKQQHPLLMIGSFVVEFLKIHPFKDGNGRLSRILTNLLLLQAGYSFVQYSSHEKLIEKNKSEYCIALRKSQKTIKTEDEDINSWLGFFLDVILEQSQVAIGILSEDHIENLLSEKQLIVWQYLQTVNQATPADIVSHTGVLRPTVNQILQKLLRLKKIERLGMGRGIRYKII